MAEPWTKEELAGHLANLIELQRIDSELHTADKRLAKIPDKERAARAGLDAEEARLAAMEERSAEEERLRRECESEIRQCEEMIREQESQLYRAKITQREYDIIGERVKALRIQIGEIEDRELALLDQAEHHSEELKGLRSSVDNLRRETADELKRLADWRRELESTMEVLRRDRPRFADALPLTILDRYRTLLQRHPDSAVVRVIDSQCSGCRMLLVSQTLLSINLGEHLTFCEHCGRFLVSESTGAGSGQG
ncbi:hypothetical protein JXA47_01555 [Candidatus Sumerlaeota bacterium]|nr:hypothetical protein [Candidatus Sumerlaeota bacterium]